MCKFFQWAGEMPVYTDCQKQSPVYKPRENVEVEDEGKPKRPKLKRQFARVERGRKRPLGNSAQERVKPKRHKLKRQFARVEKGYERSHRDSEHINYDSM